MEQAWSLTSRSSCPRKTELREGHVARAVARGGPGFWDSVWRAAALSVVQGWLLRRQRRETELALAMEVGEGPSGGGGDLQLSWQHWGPGTHSLPLCCYIMKPPKCGRELPFM